MVKFKSLNIPIKVNELDSILVITYYCGIIHS